MAVIGGWDPIRVPLGEDRYLRLIGQIDRIDEYTRDGQTYGMVIDYKSGGAHVTAQDVVLWTKTLMTHLLAFGIRLWQNAWWLHVTGGGGIFLCEEPKIPADAPISYEDAVSLAKESDAWQNSGYFSDDIELLTLSIIIFLLWI